MKTINNAVSIDRFPYEEEYSFNSERFYREAIYNLEKKLVDDPKCIASLFDWIACYHKLSLIYQHKGAVVMARKCLLIPHQSMLYMAQNNNGDEEQEQIALKAMAITIPPLLAFPEMYPSCAQYMKAEW
jgi:hypothetical protein